MNQTLLLIISFLFGSIVSPIILSIVGNLLTDPVKGYLEKRKLQARKAELREAFDAKLYARIHDYQTSYGIVTILIWFFVIFACYTILSFLIMGVFITILFPDLTIIKGVVLILWAVLILSSVLLFRFASRFSDTFINSHQELEELIFSELEERRGKVEKKGEEE